MDGEQFWDAFDETRARAMTASANAAALACPQGIRRPARLGLCPNDAPHGVGFPYANGFGFFGMDARMDTTVPGQRNASPCTQRVSNAHTHLSEQTLVSNMATGRGVPSCRCDMGMAASVPRSKHPISPSTSGSAVDKDLLKLPRTGAMLFAVALLAGCGTPPAKNFSGPWKPVNHFQNAPTEIPLNPAYVFYASPMDETLKTMLARWAKDSGRELSYQLPFDVTLYQPVAGIRTTDIESAIAQLNSIYATQGVSVTANPRRIEVEPAAASGTGATTGNATPAAPSSTTPTGTK